MAEDKFDYEKLGLKMGLEIHQQLNYFADAQIA